MTIAWSLAILGLQILVPGYLIGLSMARRSVADYFFIGFLVNATLIIVVSFFSPDKDLVIRLVYIALTLLTSVLAVVHWPSKKGDTEGGGSDRSSQKVKHVFWVGLTSTLFFAGHVAFHNLGYDDIAHLQYLTSVSEGERFPLYRSIVGGWYGARYPYFGIVIGTLGSGMRAGTFLSYYVIGVMVLTFFLVKVYEEIYHFQGNYKTAVAGAALGAMILHIGGIDSYFNFGLYPLQQSKLIVLTGLLYLLVRPNTRISFTNFTIGTMLVTLGVSYHLNLLLLVPPYLLILVLILFLRVSNWRTRARWLVMSLIFPFLVIVGGIVGSNQIIKYQEPFAGATAPATETSSRVNSPDVEKDQSARIGDWITKGRQAKLYMNRAYGVEILLLSGLFLVSTAIKLSSISWLLVLLSLGALGFGAITSAQRLPSQALSAMVRSGPIVFVADLLRSGIDIESLHKKGVITDPYSSAILRSLGVRSVAEVQLPAIQYFFSPLFTLEGVGYGILREGFDHDKIILLNTRLWGPMAFERLEDATRDTRGSIDESIDHFWNEYKYSTLAVIKNQFFRFFSGIVGPTLMSYYPAKEKWTGSISELPDHNGFDDVIIYRDSALVFPGTIEKDKIKVVEVYGSGDSIVIDREVLPPEDETIVMKFHMPQKVYPWVPKGIAIMSSLEPRIPYLLLTLNTGHLGNLGNIDRVSIKEYPCWITPEDLNVLLGITDLRRETFYLRTVKPFRSLDSCALGWLND